MSRPTREVTPIRSSSTPGAWFSDTARYHEYARLLLTELKDVTSKLKSEWPVPESETVRSPDDHPGLWDLTRKRDSLSDSVIIFSAMAVEAFLNLYGVVRLGEDNYKRLFERLGAVPKLQTLLLVCDSLSIPNNDPLVATVKNIAERRNRLVHPKSSEASGYVPAEDRPSTQIPEAAEEAFNEMLAFFQQFEVAAPDSKHLLPTTSSSDA